MHEAGALSGRALADLQARGAERVIRGGTPEPSRTARLTRPPVAHTGATLRRRIVRLRLVGMYLFVAVIYFIISYFLSNLVKQLQVRLAVPGTL